MDCSRRGRTLKEAAGGVITAGDAVVIEDQFGIT
jgi:hypothetical protein